ARGGHGVACGGAGAPGGACADQRHRYGAVAGIPGPSFEHRRVRRADRFDGLRDSNRAGRHVGDDDRRPQRRIAREWWRLFRGAVRRGSRPDLRTRGRRAAPSVPAWIRAGCLRWSGSPARRRRGTGSDGPSEAELPRSGSAMTIRVLVSGIACAVAVLMTSVVAAQREAGAAVTSHVVFTTSTSAAAETIDTAGLVARSNGVIVPIVDVAAAPPLSLVVIVDVTSSVSEAMVGFVWDGRGKANDARPSGMRVADSPSAIFLSPLLRGVVRAMAAGDRVRFGRVADAPELGREFATDAATLGRAARWVVDVPADVRHGRTPIWDAVDMAVSALEAERGRRRAILLVTDGLSTGNRVGLDAVIERAAHADVAVFVVGEAW